MMKLMIEGLREKYAILDEAIQNSDCNHEMSYYALDSLCENIILSNIIRNISNEAINFYDVVDKIIHDKRFVRGEMDKEEAKKYLESCREDACKKSSSQFDKLNGKN